MPRLMSFSASVDAIRQRTKTVTRRLGWAFLRPGERVWAIEKLDLRRGAKVVRLALLRVVSVRRERLRDITPADVIAEGFGLGLGPGDRPWTPADFVRFFRESYHVKPSTRVTRIEFAYEEETPLFASSSILSRA